jgi:hypothetical protein
MAQIYMPTGRVEAQIHRLGPGRSSAAKVPITPAPVRIVDANSQHHGEPAMLKPAHKRLAVALCLAMSFFAAFIYGQYRPAHKDVRGRASLPTKSSNQTK